MVRTVHVLYIYIPVYNILSLGNKQDMDGQLEDLEFEEELQKNIELNDKSDSQEKGKKRKESKGKQPGFQKKAASQENYRITEQLLANLGSPSPRDPPSNSNSPRPNHSFSYLNPFTSFILTPQNIFS